MARRENLAERPRDVPAGKWLRRACFALAQLGEGWPATGIRRARHQAYRLNRVGQRRAIKRAQDDLPMRGAFRPFYTFGEGESYRIYFDPKLRRQLW